MEEDDSDVNLILQGIISSAKSNHMFPYAVSAMLTELRVSARKLFFSYWLSLFRILRHRSGSSQSINFYQYSTSA